MKRPVAPIGDLGLQLRLIEEVDLDTTLEWRNREDIRVWFKTADIISPSQHREWFQRYLTKDDDFLFVAVQDGMLVGQGSIYDIEWAAGRAQIGRFLVAPEHQNKGLARSICRHLIDFAWSTLELTQLYLEVREQNERAIRAYAANNFQVHSRYDGLLRMELARPQ